MINLIIGIFIMATIYLVYTLLLKKLEEIEERAITRHVLLEDWLFQSLYSINHKVLLPSDPMEWVKDHLVSGMPATVYSPEDDPMNEFKKGDF